MPKNLTTSVVTLSSSRKRHFLTSSFHYLERLSEQVDNFFKNHDSMSAFLERER